MIRYFIILLIFFSIGCARTSWIEADGQKYTFRGSKYEYVSFKEGDKEIVFDRRGRPSFVKELLTLMFANLPNVGEN